MIKQPADKPIEPTPPALVHPPAAPPPHVDTTGTIEYLTGFIKHLEDTYAGKSGKNPFVITKAARQAIVDNKLSLADAKAKFPMDHDPDIKELSDTKKAPSIDYGKVPPPRYPEVKR